MTPGLSLGRRVIYILSPCILTFAHKHNDMSPCVELLISLPADYHVKIQSNGKDTAVLPPACRRDAGETHSQEMLPLGNASEAAALPLF